MNTSGVLDDYLDELLGEAVAIAAPAAAIAAAAPEREPTWDDLPDEVIYETGDSTVAAATDDASLEAAFEAAAVAAPEREPTWDDLPDEVIYETGDSTVAVATDDASLEAAFEAAAVAAPEREPTWDDLPDEVIYETGDSAAASGSSEEPAAAKPTWDDLPDEVIYETDGAESHHLAHTDSPALQAAFEAAAVGGAVPPHVPAAAAAPAPAAPRPAPPPASRTAAPPPRVSLDAPAGNRPGSWQELQAQAHQPPHGTHPHNRRAAERTSRWLRLRCGTQAYALELLKVQEVVLPVPLLPLRGTAAAMLGIMNLRGQVVPVMDLGIHLGTVTAEDDAQTRIVVLEENGETLGLRVSAVEDVANLTDSQIEPPDTARICQISNDLFRGVARISQRPMILLDATRLLG
ncbi:chemotaxis protein CheW [Stenotrophomonas sp. ESTM1D_MKCIP4_1]|uniref:chemotaxis protein CheW n=1 Tax=Stenotrophomonas sp. ESTM1D_MKCIP4_1 TaxID=2072414 RepID=UPI000D54012B|nr:chemotaxis protein CheW [Stenotrophomonas sp. ESTM1D_MKCIP4_1]AWH53413.1 chemotaxis protein CheW [Stenotrophomonas sp. ESTM1D_MKCIP4_1]